MKKKLLCLTGFIFLCLGGCYFHLDDPSYPVTDTATISIGVFGDVESSFMAVFGSADFKSKFPNITIILEPGDFGSHHNRLVAEIAAGEGANDIECMEIGYLCRFAAAGGFTDLAVEPYYGVYAGQALAPFSLSNARTVDNKLLAMPLDIAPAVMYYRKSILDAAGIDPTTLTGWNDYIEKGKLLTVDKNGDGTIDQYALTNAWDLSMIPLNGGYGDWLKDGAPYEPKERFLGEMQLVHDVRTAGIDAAYLPWSGDWMNGFGDGKVVTMFSGSWLGGHFKNWMCPELAGDWRVTYPPGKVYAAYGGTYIGIPEQTAESKKGIAWSIIRYLCTSPEAQLLSFKITDAFPALTTVYNDPVMSEPVDYFGGQQVRLIYKDIALKIPKHFLTKDDEAAKDIFQRELSYVLDNGKSPEEAYDAAKTDMLSWLE